MTHTTPHKSWNAAQHGVHGISDAAYEQLHKRYRSHRAVFEAAAQHQSPRRHGLAGLCSAHNINPTQQDRHMAMKPKPKPSTASKPMTGKPKGGKKGC